MIEARVFVTSLDSARSILKQENAELKGSKKEDVITGPSVVAVRNMVIH